jgi:two-component system, sporulation sensor kinase E
MVELKDKWKLWLLAAAVVIVAVSVYYTNKLANELAEEERKKIEIWASAYKQLNSVDYSTDIGFITDIIDDNTTIPVLLVDENDNIIFWRNFDSVHVANHPDYLKKQFASMKTKRKPLILEIEDGIKQYVYYTDSFALLKLKYYPIVQLIIIGIFLVVAYMAFSNARNAEQNRVWVGMAKETAHQLGTPISSLTAWVELLKNSATIQPEAVDEIEKDVSRLELITERFSKIGSSPTLELQNVSESILKNIDYIKHRSSKNVVFNISVDDNLMAQFNPPLFDWVMENLLKNALDAMEGKGNIAVIASEDDSHVFIDVKDSGKGIPSSKFNTVFQPGYSTKKRGWGLGLTLVKRIVENYHHGKVFVKESEIGKCTTFRIILNKSLA